MADLRHKKIFPLTAGGGGGGEKTHLYRHFISCQMSTETKTAYLSMTLDLPVPAFSSVTEFNNYLHDNGYSNVVLFCSSGRVEGSNYTNGKVTSIQIGYGDNHQCSGINENGAFQFSGTVYNFRDTAIQLL